MDHFIPWSYVVHNELWNLVPVPAVPNINSSKSNCLPADKYIDKFVGTQYELLNFQHKSISNPNRWKNLIAPYGDLLRINEEDLLDRNRFSEVMKSVVIEQIEGARRLGFAADWIL